MTATTITAAGASDSLAISSGNDGTLVIQSGPTGAKVNALTLSSAGIPTFDQLTQSLGGNGYAKLPGGLIIQWGSVTSSGTAVGNAAITFPLTFPTAVYSLVAVCSTTANNLVVTGTQTTSGASSTTVYNAHLNTGATGIPVQWIAVGK